ncbi:MAG: HAMP domain-containing histidine kinase [Thioalkalivibrio sp.]|nr:HAMP domain-containing histidine kinase [Thioalkalivibrio sp.]
MTSMVAALRWEVQQRDILVDALVHDIRTPLLAIRNSLAFIRSGPTTSDFDGDQAGLAHDTVSEVQSTLSLIDDVAIAHRLERSLVGSSRERVDLFDLAKRVVERVRIADAAQGLSLQVRGTPNSVSADATALERAFANLLDNALRFAETAVRVEVFPGLIRIVDDGPGMDWAPGRPFAPYQGGSRMGSFGLGLYIASTILDAHGGRLLVETSGPGGTVLLAYVGGAGGP